MNCRSCKIREFAIYQSATESELDQVMGCRKAMLTFKKGQLVADGVKNSQFVGTIYSGLAFSFALLNDGRRQIISFYREGDIVFPPEIFARGMQGGVRALTDCVVCQFDKNQFLEIIKSSNALVSSYFSYWFDCKKTYEERLIQLGMLNAEEAVASLVGAFLRRQRERGGMENRITFPLRLGHIAEAVGITEIHAGRIMRTLEKRDVIKRDGPDHLIVDEYLLQQIVQFL